jgi:hypothetical protein
MISGSVLYQKVLQRKYFVFGLIVLLFVASALQAQTTGKISGHIYDARTNENLIGANVIVSELQTGTATDLNGNFSILRLYPGRYTIQATFVGYAVSTIQGVVVSVDRTTFLDIPLRMKEINLDEVVVTAERPIVVKDKTYSSSSFEADDISKLPTEGVRDILDLNTSFQRNANGSFSLRGGTSTDINFMIDGVTQDNSNTGVPGTNYMGDRANTSWKYDFNPLGVKQMELISGGFSAEYGNAQSGLVKIVTKEGSSWFHGDLRFEYRPPGKYHWGDYLYGDSNLEWQNWGQFEQWQVWRDTNYPDPNDSKYIPDDSLKTYYYDRWVETHSPNPMNPLGVYDYRKGAFQRIMFGFGGPLGKLPGWTFFLSGESRSKPTRLPTNERFTRYDNYNLTTVSRFSEKLNLRSMFQYQHSRSGIFSGSDDIRWAAPVGNVSFNAGKQKYLLITEPPKDEYSWIQSFNLTYIFNPESFFDLTLSHTYESYEVNSTPLSTKVQAPPGPWDEEYKRLLWDPSATAYNQDVRTHTWALRGDYTNQFSHWQQLKAGFQSTYRKMHYSAVSSSYANALIYRTGFAEYYKAQPLYGVLYIQDRMEYEGMIANIGLRAEAFNNGIEMPADVWNPFYMGTGTGANAIGDPKTVHSKTNTAISPRVGLSFPVGEKTAFRLQYGHFYAMPNFRHTLSKSTYSGWIMYGNPNLGFRKTINYEFGVQYSLWGTHKVDLVAFYNDRTRQTTNIRRHFDTGSVGRSASDPYAATYVNNAYGATKGLELEIEKRSIGRLRYRLKYTLSRSTSGVYGPSEIWAEDDPNRPYDMRKYIQRANDNITDSDKTHALSVFVSYSLNRQEGWHLGNLYPFQNTTLSLTYSARSGMPYTLVETYDQFNSLSNNRRYPIEYETNLSLTKIFKLGVYNCAISCRIENLFNNKWLTPFDVYVESDNLFAWVDSGTTWENDPYNYYRTYRNVPREVYFSFGVGF